MRRFHPDMTREAAVEAGLEATVEVARIMQPDADGFYLITPFNRADIMVQLHEGCASAPLLDHRSEIQGFLSLAKLKRSNNLD